MAHRVFVDRNGQRWEVIPASRSEWQFQPVEGNPGPSRLAPPPGYETDPYELSVEELQRLLDSAAPRRAPTRKSPFLE
jgi:hypothetical protein